MVSMFPGYSKMLKKDQSVFFAIAIFAIHFTTLFRSRWITWGVHVDILSPTDLFFPNDIFFSFISLTYWISHDGKEWRRNDSLRVTSLVYWMTHARCIVIGHHRGEWKSLSDYTTVVSISETYQNLNLRQNFKEKYLTDI